MEEMLKGNMHGIIIRSVNIAFLSCFILNKIKIALEQKDGFSKPPGMCYHSNAINKNSNTDVDPGFLS